MTVHAACMMCTNASLQLVPTRTPEDRVAFARHVIQGLLVGVASAREPASFAAIKASRPSPLPRVGTCIVERCAQMIERPCNACRSTICPRCVVAQELRDNEERINSERDAELALLDEPPTEDDLDGYVDGIAKSLCGAHRPVGDALIQEWYARKTFTTPRSGPPSTGHGPRSADG